MMTYITMVGMNSKYLQNAFWCVFSILRTNLQISIKLEMKFATLKVPRHIFLKFPLTTYQKAYCQTLTTKQSVFLISYRGTTLQKKITEPHKTCGLQVGNVWITPVLFKTME